MVGRINTIYLFLLLSSLIFFIVFLFNYILFARVEYQLSV
jgi:hypothetical protein